MLHKERLMTVISLLVSAALGWLLPHMQLYAMNFVSRTSPVPGLLKNAGVDGAGFIWALYPFDFAALVVCSLPVAFVITRLRPARLWLYTAVATLPFFLALNFTLLRSGLLTLSNATVQQWLSSLFVLPLAVCVVTMIGRRRGPNSSFKSKLLRSPT